MDLALLPEEPEPQPVAARAVAAAIAVAAISLVRTVDPPESEPVGDDTEG
jgi:hypothetical protein